LTKDYVVNIIIMVLIKMSTRKELDNNFSTIIMIASLDKRSALYNKKYKIKR